MKTLFILQVGSSRLIVSPGPPVDLSEGFDLESASARGSREGSIVSGVTVTTAGGGKLKRTASVISSDPPFKDLQVYPWNLDLIKNVNNNVVFPT